MRIHTDTLTTRDIYEAARIGHADVVVLTEHKSRSRDHAFTVKLEGDSRRRPNGGRTGGDGSGYAATWDQWGVFLAVLFDRDPEMVTPYYADAYTFHWQTDFRFVPQTKYFNAAGSGVIVWWPEDAHGDHTFRFAGEPGGQECTKCSAIRRWQF